MTEEEAKTKWCPMVRLGKNSGMQSWHEQGEELRNPIESRCIGSACMMWRWAFKKNDASETVSDTDGYCGIGGAQPW